MGMLSEWRNRMNMWLLERERKNVCALGVDVFAKRRVMSSNVLSHKRNITHVVVYEQ